MADTRINSLTTSSVSVTDDFLPIDGATAGTKKLSAFSPSFGGAVTVGQTLTVTGNLTNGELHVTNGTSGHSRSIYSLSGVGKTEIGYGPNGYGFAHPTASYISYVDGLYFGVAAGATSMTLSTSGNLTVAGTTISLGGGSGSIASVLNGAAGNYKLHLYQSGGVDRWYCGIQAAAETGSNAGAPFGITALSDAGAQIDIPLQIVRAAGGSIFFGRPVKAQDTTASTSTITGALVVGSGGSGGLGVAGAIVTGGIVRCGGSNGLSLGSDTGNIRIDTAGPAGVEFRGLSSADTVTGFTMREMALIDGTTAPSTRAGYATIYVDTADGDLKVKFGDGTVKTIATDT